MLHKLTPIILAGGQGARLKPFTSDARPKPFLKVASRLTLLQETLERCRQMAPPIIVCDAKWAKVVAEQCTEINIQPRIILAEPAPRSTAPAIAAAALGMKPDEVMIVMPSDHIINDQRAFEESIKEALSHIKTGNIISLGVTPKSASTRYGYIQRGEKITENLYESSGFHEKPSAENAQKFKELGDFVWNSGVFITFSDNIVQKFTDLRPEILENIKKSSVSTNKNEKILNLDLDNYQKIQSISIDVAILERCTHMHVYTLRSDWRDIGTLPAFLSTWIRRLFAIIIE